MDDMASRHIVNELPIRYTAWLLSLRAAQADEIVGLERHLRAMHQDAQIVTRDAKFGTDLILFSVIQQHCLQQAAIPRGQLLQSLPYHPFCFTGVLNIEGTGLRIDEI